MAHSWLILEKIGHFEGTYGGSAPDQPPAGHLGPCEGSGWAPRIPPHHWQLLATQRASRPHRCRARGCSRQSVSGTAAQRGGGGGHGSVQSQGLGHRGGLSYSTLPQLIRMALSSNWEWGVPSGRECCNGQGVRRTDRCDKWRLVLSACADVADM